MLSMSIVPSTLKSTKKDAKKMNKTKITHYVWCCDTYMKTDDFIKNGGIPCTLEEKIKVLEEEDNYYNDRIYPDNTYIFYGDIDGFGDEEDGNEEKFEWFRDELIQYLKQYHHLDIARKEVFHTTNEGKIGSFHFTIPKLHATAKTIRKIMEDFILINSEGYTNSNFILNDSIVDLSIYDKHWFRLPNQTKGITCENKNGKKVWTKYGVNKHIIKHGEMIDFILEHIPEDSTNIEDCKIFERKQKKSNKKIIKKEEESDSDQYDSDGNLITYEHNPNIVTSLFTGKKSTKKETKSNKKSTKKKVIKEVAEEDEGEEELLKHEMVIISQLIDECIVLVENESYNKWVKLGMSINSKFGNDGFELFKNLSNKREWKNMSETEIKSKYDSFKRKSDNGITIGTLYFIAKEDNEDKYFEILGNSVNYEKIDSTTICKLIAMLKPDHFIWKGKKIYCYTGVRWEQDDSELVKYIANDLHLFLTKKLMSLYKGKEFIEKIKKVEKLRNDKFIEDTVKMSRRYLTNNEIEFDNKDNLLGFTNLVLDLKTYEFREYKFDDYVTITTGYKWFDPEQEEIDKVNELIASIHSDEEIRNFFLEFVSTSLDGKPLEKFLILNGEGRNGKGLFDDLLLKALGNYGLIGNCALLFEKAKTGANPEKANIDNKRIVIFREPPKDSKIENASMNELTGGGVYSARGCHENDTKKTLKCTVMCECNYIPQLRYPPKKAEANRYTEIKYKNTFTCNPEEVNEDKGIFIACDEYKTNEFQDLHKRALILILINSHKSFVERDRKFNIPKAIKELNDAYLKKSDEIFTWFDSRFVFTENEDDFVPIAQIYKYFKLSLIYHDSSQKERRSGDFSATNFKEALKSNIFIKQKECSFVDRRKKDGVDYYSILTKIRIKTIDELITESTEYTDIEEVFVGNNIF